MITKERIIIVAVLLAVIAGFGAVYVFYFQAKMDSYAQNKKFMVELDATYKDLSDSFSGYEPDGLIALWKQQLQPWADNRLQLATYYTLEDWQEHETPPEEVAIVKFWYEEEAKKMEKELYQHVYEKMGDYSGRFPLDLRETLGVKKLDDWQGVDVNKKQVNAELAKFAFGVNVSKFLVDNSVTAINEFQVWPLRKEKGAEKLLDYLTVGLDINITLENFVKLMDKLRTSTRFFTVDAITMNYPYIMYQGEPSMSVKLLLTQSTYIGPKEIDKAGNANAASVYQNAAMTNRAGAAVGIEPPTFMGSVWKWFKTNILVMN